MEPARGGEERSLTSFVHSIGLRKRMRWIQSVGNWLRVLRTGYPAVAGSIAEARATRPYRMRGWLGDGTSFRPSAFRCRRSDSRCATPTNMMLTRVSGTPPPVDLRYVRDHLAQVQENIQRRGVDVNATLVVQLYERFCALTAEVDQVRKQRNEVAARMKNMQKLSPEERSECIALGKQLKERVTALEAELAETEQQLYAEAVRIPNRTHPDAPVGGEDQARLLRMAGKPRDFTDFSPKDHVELAQRLDIVDFEAAAKVSGARFYFLRNAGAMLELALVNWAMQHLTGKHGFIPLIAPDLVREETVWGCGFQPRGEASQVYSVADTSLCLAGTAEIPLGGYYANEILDETQLPIKMAAVSHCFRREAGAAGTETRGLYRVHQFTKVEMFVLSRPEESDRVHQELRSIEEELFDALGLHYRVLDMPTRELGNPAYRKFDIEAWMPGRNAFGEISSASNCTDYQARRLNIRYREQVSEKLRFVHTLNATACAVPRMIVSILENFQEKDGSVTIPQVLRPFLAGLERIQVPPERHTPSRITEPAGAQPTR
jgi:seryl-tRNA synthetase